MSKKTTTRQKLKIGEIFQDEDGNETIDCCHCLKEFDSFTDFTFHIIQNNYFREGRLQPKEEVNQDIDFEKVLIKVESDSYDGTHSESCENVLVDHPERETIAKDYLTCSVCRETFDNKAALNNHFELAHTLPPNGSLFECGICSMSFKIYRQFREHVSTHMDGTDEKNIELPTEKLEENFECNQELESDKFVCGICNWKSKNRKLFLTHQRGHVDNRIACSTCGKKVTANNMRGHMKNHTNTADHICDICGRSFIKKGLMVQHLLTHNKDYQHKCDICSEKFYRTDRLLIHYRQNHKSKLNFYCRTCNVGFMDRKSLIRHENIHLTKANDDISNSQFHCGICNTAFKTKGNLIDHNRTIHPK